MPTCMAVGCCNTSGKSDKNISYFMFPVHDPPRVRSWIANLKREDLPSDFWPEKKHVICSQHFEKECFQEDMRARIFAGVYGEESPLANQRRRLTHTAVPTLFCYTTGKKKRPLSMNRRQLARQHNTASEAVGSTGANGDRKSVSVEERSSAASTSRRPKRKRRSFCDSATQCTKTETCDTGVQCDLLSPYDGRSTKSEWGQNVWELETENIKVETVQIKVEPE